MTNYLQSTKTPPATPSAMHHMLKRVVVLTPEDIQSGGIVRQQAAIARDPITGHCVWSNGILERIALTMPVHVITTASELLPALNDWWMQRVLLHGGSIFMAPERPATERDPREVFIDEWPISDEAYQQVQLKRGVIAAIREARLRTPFRELFMKIGVPWDDDCEQCSAQHLLWMLKQKKFGDHILTAEDYRVR